MACVLVLRRFASNRLELRLPFPRPCATGYIGPLSLVLGWFPLALEAL